MFVVLYRSGLVSPILVVIVVILKIITDVFLVARLVSALWLMNFMLEKLRFCSLSLGGTTEQ